jgi:DNA-binding MarR family transcriptional regulator
VTTISTDTRVANNKILQALDVIRNLDFEMPIGQAVSLFLIAQGETKDDGGLTVTELGTKGGFALATASRYMKALADKDRRGDPGLGLVSHDRDPYDERRKVLRLTPRGLSVITQIQKVLGI